MKLSKQIDFQNVEALSLALGTERISRVRLAIEIPARDAANALYAAMKAEVEYRGNHFVFDNDTRAHILRAAEWLVDPSAPPSLLLCGLYGNGKTTLARAVGRLIGHISESELGYSRRKNARFITAKAITELCVAGERFKEQYVDYRTLPQEEILVIDDIGEEPKEVLVYGMVYTPLIELLSQRYDSQRMTIITTNLNVNELKERYGERIYDRLNEMVRSIVFRNASYRGKTHSAVDNA